MKKITAVLSLILCLCTLFGCGSYKTDEERNRLSQSDDKTFSFIPVQTPPDSNVYSFHSYAALSEALLRQDSSLHSDSNKYGELFDKTISSFNNKAIDLRIPLADNEVLPLRNKEEFANISFMTAELYNLPWIWYHCKFNGVEIEIKLAYPSVMEYNELNSAKTYCEFLHLIAPDAPNPNNYTKYESYRNIYEAEINLANNKKVVAMISELIDSSKIYVMFPFEGLLVSVYADKQVLSSSFWDSFSLEKYISQ